VGAQLWPSPSATEAGDGTHPIDQASRVPAFDSIERHQAAQPGIEQDVSCSSGFYLHDIRQRFPELPMTGADSINRALDLSPQLEYPCGNRGWICDNPFMFHCSEKSRRPAGSQN
jgi:hypothetical protein